jgi:hypothetical protein
LSDICWGIDKKVPVRYSLNGSKIERGKTMSHPYVGPYIDENVEHVGVSRLRSLNATNLRNIDKTFVIQENDKPLAVLLSYDQFLNMQRQLVSVANTLELISAKDEVAQFLAGLSDSKNGQEKAFEEIEAELVERQS